MTKPKVLAIVGPTASGKSDLAVELALRLGGEVISTDSRQVYRGLDIGSGKITTPEMRDVPHYLLDIANLAKETYTGADFSRDAKAAIENILKRDKLPIVTGGTFFWLELLRGRKAAAPVPPNPILRAELEKLSNEELFTKLLEKDEVRAKTIDEHNRRRLIRSLEIIESLGKVPSADKGVSTPYDWVILGIDIDKADLEKRIKTRLENRLKKGMVDEVENLLEQGISSDKLISFGLEYRYITEYLQNKITYTEMQELIIIKSRQFAKRQYTWLKADSDIIWKKFPVDVDKLEEEVKTLLDN
ncbi:MAG: tRNA (adenosine(37)-N6)-dimethylallyltransferase MiaA [Candidatus Nomurabacteria bacterium]|nr:tRNA (adenosine(37)-N6)-dimethylallyltransferase MiaA [Candidatus Nomurabacteria bacterium]USN87699.1 MAG: tRNA (adenosine(37)-N6)-dimethylallyltransferase MiaA [Candidatus Nomurabacteria bacterium]